MNRDDVLGVAQQAGWSVPLQWDETDGFLMLLERFAALVAAHEREECAKVCDEFSENFMKEYHGEEPYSIWSAGYEDDFLEGKSRGADSCAEAIRARGES